MSGKRQRRKLARYVAQQAKLLDLALSQLLVKELQVDARMRSQALKAAKKREVNYIQ